MDIATYTYQSDFVGGYVEQGRAEGRAEGEANALVEVLDARGIAVPEAAHARIRACADTEQLSRWVRRAATAQSVDEVFDEG